MTRPADSSICGASCVRLTDSITDQLWMATGGAMLVLLRSIVDGTRRKWYAILIGCILGAAGSAVAGSIWHDSRFVFPICGAAAVMAENIILGLFNASQEFRDEPIKVFATIWRTVVPWFFNRAEPQVDVTIDDNMDRDLRKVPADPVAKAA